VASLSLIVLAGCADTDVVARYSPESFSKIVDAYPELVVDQTLTDHYYYLSVDKETTLKISHDYEQTGTEDIIVVTPLQPFTDAGLDVTKLSAGYRADDTQFYITVDYGKGTGEKSNVGEQMAPAKTILVVDDEEKITEVLKSYLENEGFRVVCAHNGAQGLQLFEKESPVLILLDLMLPDISGEDICRAIRAKSSVPIIMLTAKIEEENVIRGLGLGADDYVTKPFSPRQLMARVEAVLRRSSEEMDGSAAAYSYDDGDLTIDDSRHLVQRGGESIALTPNEYKILTILAKHSSKIFTRDELIAYALGDEFDGYDRVIDTHIKNIRLKLGEVNKSHKYIITVHGTGYRFGGEAR